MLSAHRHTFSDCLSLTHTHTWPCWWIDCVSGMAQVALSNANRHIRVRGEYRFDGGWLGREWMRHGLGTHTHTRKVVDETNRTMQTVHIQHIVRNNPFPDSIHGRVKYNVAAFHSLYSHVRTDVLGPYYIGICLYLCYGMVVMVVGKLTSMRFTFTVLAWFADRITFVSATKGEQYANYNDQHREWKCEAMVVYW